MNDTTSADFMIAIYEADGRNEMFGAKITRNRLEKNPNSVECKMMFDHKKCRLIYKLY